MNPTINLTLKIFVCLGLMLIGMIFALIGIMCGIYLTLEFFHHMEYYPSFTQYVNFIYQPEVMFKGIGYIIFLSICTAICKFCVIDIGDYIDYLTYSKFYQEKSNHISKDFYLMLFVFTANVFFCPFLYLK